MKIVIVDDHKIVRDGFEQLINSKTEHHVIGSAGTGLEAIELVSKLKPDLLITDISIGDMNGIEVAKTVNKNYPNVKIIALSMHAEKMYVFEMLKAGALAYLPKDVDFEELSKAIETVSNNEIYLSSSISAAIVDDYVSKIQNKEKNLFEILTKREIEVLKLIADGLSTSQIGTALELSDKTVEAHRRNIMTKLNIFNIVLLTKLAIREGITTL